MNSCFILRQQVKNRCFFFVLVTAGALLAVTGFAKLWSALGTARALMAPDPLSGIPFKYLLASVGVVEIVVATICFLGRSRLFSVGLVAWLSTNFLLYRIGLCWIGWKQPCGCMGSLTDALHIKPETADNIAKVILAFLLISSYGLLLCAWRKARQARRMEHKGEAKAPADVTFSGSIQTRIIVMLLVVSSLLATCWAKEADLPLALEWKAHFKAKLVIENCVFERINLSSGNHTNLYQARYQEDAFLMREIGSPADAVLDHITTGSMRAGRWESNYWAIEWGRVLKLFPNADRLIREGQNPEVSLDGGGYQKALANIPTDTGPWTASHSWKRAFIIGLVVLAGIGLLFVWRGAKQDSAVQGTPPGTAVCLILFQCFLWLWPSASEAAMIIEGRISLVLDPSKPMVKAAYALPFRVEADDCKWTIGIQKSRIAPHLKEISYGSDGESLYYLETLSSSFLKAHADLDVVKSGVVSYGTIPPFDFNHFVHLWYVYGSRCAVKVPDALPCVLAFPTNNSQCMLPAKVILGDDGLTVFSAEAFKRDLSGGKGPLILQYELLESTNTLGRIVPMSFVFRAYNEGPKGMTKCVWSLHGEADTIRFTPDPVSGQPNANGLFRVTDYRVPSAENRNYAVYFSTNRWYETNSPELELLRITSGHRPKLAQVSAVSKRRRMIALASLGVSTALFVVIVAITHKQKTKLQKKGKAK